MHDPLTRSIRKKKKKLNENAAPFFRLARSVTIVSQASREKKKHTHKKGRCAGEDLTQ